ncbi:hypothetical protein C9890_0274 [Perkinsus sp. BL_2016]|nr:hypothetical protein C9890_0274 [Perkinsus sp. BL_2016]
MIFRSLVHLGQRVQPREKLAHAASQRERLLRQEGVSRYNKRFRSWTQHRVRQYTLKQPAVTLSPSMTTASMQAASLAAAFQKSASLRKLDLKIWRKLANRAMKISDSITPQHMAYIFYGIGKSRFLHTKLIARLLDCVTQEHLAAMTSHGVMSILWTLRRTHMHPGQKFLMQISDHLVKYERIFRPKDFLKCLHALAFFGHRKMDVIWRSEISSLARNKMDLMHAQEMRAATEPLTLANIYTDDVRKYVLDRFRGIAITARPNHLMKTLEAAVTMRILRPEFWWQQISDHNRNFLIKLSERHINFPGKRKTPLHEEISDVLERLQVSHRMLLRMGPFTVDFVLEDAPSVDETADGHGSMDPAFLRKKKVLLVDNLSSFFVNDFRFTEETILRHRLLHDMGIEIFRVAWHEWVGAVDKQKFLANVLQRGHLSVGDFLRRQVKLEAGEVERFARLKNIERTAGERREDFRPHFETYRRWLQTRSHKRKSVSLDNLAL